MSFRPNRPEEDKLMQPGPCAAKRLASASNAQRRASLSLWQEMVNHVSNVIITGLGKVGPWGDARTRWEMGKTKSLALMAV